jgi:hypothetical protein
MVVNVIDRSCNCRIFFIGNGLIWVGQLAFIIAFVSTDDGNRRENVVGPIHLAGIV